MVDSRQIEYTLKVKNDPANTAAAAQLAKSFESIVPLTEAQNKAIADQVTLLKLATAQADARLKSTQAETALIEKQTAAIRQQATARALANKAAVVGGGGTGGGGAIGFLGGVAAAHSGEGVGETARLSESGVRLNLFSRLNAFVDIAIAGIIGNKILGIANNFAELTGKIKVNTDTEAEAAGVRRKLIELSEETHSSLEQNVESWEKLTQVGKRYHMTQNEVIGVQKTLFEGIRIGGASTERAQGVMEQFIMMLNRGRATGLGFNSVFRQSPEFLNMLAKAMNVPIAAFSTMGRKGRLSMDQLLEGVQKVQKEVQEKFAKLPVTMTEGFRDLATSFDVAIGTIGERMRLSPLIGQAFEKLAGTFQNPAVIAALSNFANIVGSVLVKALQAAVNVMVYFGQHTDELRALMDVLSVLMISRVIGAFINMGRAATTGYSALGLLGNGLGRLIKLTTGLNLANFVKGVAPAAAAAEGEIAGVGVAAEGAGLITATAFLGIPVAIAAVVGALYVFGDKMDASGRHAYTVRDVIVGAFFYTKDAIIGFWQNDLEPAIVNVFHNIVKTAKEDAAAVKSAWTDAIGGVDKALGYIPGVMETRAGAGALHNWLDKHASWATTDIGAALTRKVNSGVEAAGTRGAQIAAAAKAKAAADAAAAAKEQAAEAAAMAKRMKGGVPVGDLGGAKKAKDDHRLADAMLALQDFIEKTKEATTEQDALNVAILKGPIAERAAQATAAYNKTALDEKVKIQKASVKAGKDYHDVVLTAAQADKVAEAATAAQNLELDKQRGEYDKLIESIKLAAQAQDEDTQHAYSALQVWTADAALRRQRIIDLARENAEYQKRAEITRQWGVAGANTPEALDAIHKAGVAGANDAALKDAQESVNKFNELLKQSNDYTDQGLSDWKAIVLQVQTSKQYLASTPAEVAAVNRELQKIKPPTNFMEALHKGLQGFTDDFKMGWAQVADGIKGTISNLANSFIEMAVSGKFHFKQLALSVIQDLERMILKALIFKAVMGIMNAIFPGSGTVLGAAGGGGGGGYTGAPKGHSGGIAGMGADSMFAFNPAIFANAKRFHMGGLAGLRSGEIPIIAKAGEAIMPTVRMPDGTFGVKAMGSGGTIFAPNITIGIDAKGRGPGGGEMTHEQQAKLTQLLDDEINTHLQRKLEEWMRPGGPLQGARR